MMQTVTLMIPFVLLKLHVLYIYTFIIAITSIVKVVV